MTGHRYGAGYRDPSVAHFSWGTFNLRPDPEPMLRRQGQLQVAGEAMAALLALQGTELADRLVAYWRDQVDGTDSYGRPTDPDEHAALVLGMAMEQAVLSGQSIEPYLDHLAGPSTSGPLPPP